MTALDLFNANLDKARQRLSEAEVAILRAAFPFQRAEALEARVKAARAVAVLEALANRASQYENEDEVAFLDMRAPEF